MVQWALATDEAWTVERHLHGKRPEVIALYHRFIEMAQACGPFTYAVAKRLYVHHFRVEAPGQLDGQFVGWLAEAYQVGAGAHLGGADIGGLG